jgi:hypothetical protein
MLVWGIATVVILIKNGTVPPEYWTLPAVGLGGLLAALNSLNNRKSKKSEEDEDEPPAKEGAIKEPA